MLFQITNHVYRFVGINVVCSSTVPTLVNAHKQDLVANKSVLHFSCLLSGIIMQASFLSPRVLSVIDALRDAQ